MKEKEKRVLRYQRVSFNLLDVHYRLDVPETLYGVAVWPRRLNKVLVGPRNAYGLVWVEVIRLVVVR